MLTFNEAPAPFEKRKGGKGKEREIRNRKEIDAEKMQTNKHKIAPVWIVSHYRLRASEVEEQKHSANSMNSVNK